MIETKPVLEPERTTPDRGLGYLHKWYETAGEHVAESVWQECMCRSCQDHRELRNHVWGTSFRNRDERY